MIYRNRKTGFIFETISEVHGEEWEIVSPTPIKDEKPKRRKVKKDE